MPNIIEITDFSARELDVYARLTERQLLNRHEPDKGIFIAESPKVITRALDAGYTPISFLMESRHVETQAKELIARCADIPVYTAPLDVLTRLTGFQLTRGMLCAMYRLPLPPIQQVCARARRIAVLEQVENPTNVGAIFRSAAALGMDAVLLTPGCSNPLYRRAIRVSMGTVFQIPWTFFPGENVWPGSGMDLLAGMGFEPQPWLYVRILWPLMMSNWLKRKNWPLYWERKEMGWRQTRWWPAATTPCGSPCPTAWIP